MESQSNTERKTNEKEAQRRPEGQESWCQRPPPRHLKLSDENSEARHLHIHMAGFPGRVIKGWDLGILRPCDLPSAVQDIAILCSYQL